MKRLLKILSDTILLACICVAVFSGWNLYQELSEYKAGEEAYGQLIPEVVKIDETTNEPQFDWEALRNTNADMIGWIRMEDSTINYPFVQGTDNLFYLKHMFDGAYNNAGCVFMDATNAPDFSDKNTILYAHNMKNGTMFADIEKFKDPEYYSSHKSIQLYTETATYDVYPVAGVVTDGYEDYVRTTFADDADFVNYVDRFVSESTFQSDETINPADQIVMFSTCNYSRTNGRYVMIGKLIRR